jgi:hypothetical protein
MVTTLAALLLRLSGATVEYRVQRIRPKPTVVGTDEQVSRVHTTDGITVLRTPNYREAKRKFRSMRASNIDTIKIRLVATVKQRQGNVEST